VKAREEKEVEEVRAMGLSKYVIKKGRFTVRPERVFAMGGWLPERLIKEEKERSEIDQGNGEWGIPSVSGAEEEDSAGDAGQEGGGDGLASANVPPVVEKVVLDEEAAAGATTGEACGTNWEAEAWSWDEVEEERLRGLDVARGWLALDGELFAEFGET